MESTDHELVALVVAMGDKKAYGVLVHRYQTLIRGLLMRMTSNAALADDLSQATFIHAHKKIGTYTGKGSFKGWLCRIAHNEFLQARRKKKAADAVLEKYREHQDIQPQASHWDVGDTMDLDLALSRLKEPERVAIIMCYSGGLSHSEASDAMGLPVGTIKSHINRGKKKLRELLEEQEVVTV